MVTAKFAVLADHAVTGDEHGDRVAGYGVADRAGSLGHTNGQGDVLVCHHRTARDAQQGFPDLDLEIGAVQEQVQCSHARARRLEDLRAGKIRTRALGKPWTMTKPLREIFTFSPGRSM